MPNPTLYSSDKYFVDSGLTLPQNVYGTSNGLDNVSKYNGIHFVPRNYETYNPFFYFTIDSQGGTGIDVSVAIRRVSDNAYMTEILKTGSSASFTEMQPTTPVPGGGSQMYGVRFKNYLNGGLQPNVQYRFSIRLDRPEQSVLSATNSYTFQISTSVGGITFDNQQQGQPLFLAAYVNNLVEYCKSWSSTVTGNRMNASISDNLPSLSRGDSTSELDTTGLLGIFTAIGAGFYNISNYVYNLSTSKVLQGYESQYKKNGESVPYNYGDYINEDIVVGNLITSAPIIGTNTGDNRGVLGGVLYL